MEHGQAGTSATPAPRVRVVRRASGWRATAPLTPIRGREPELAAVAALLDDPAVRLVTVTGPGGIGKTRLAREVALRLQDDFADGACFIPFASVRDAGGIVAAIVRALDLQPSGRRDLNAFVFEALRDRHMLLVLDNLEHLADAVSPWLAALLERCPRVTVQATSRMPLKIGGEHRFMLGPLGLPPIEQEAGLEGTMAHAAVALFVERVRAIVPEFELTPHNADAVIRISRMLGGLPLAIELAAAQIRLLPPEHLAERLDGRITGLTDDRIDMPDRHRTMGAAIAWSHDLLSPEHQPLFRWLSVFPGGFSLDAIEAVGAAAGVPGADVALLALVEHSLVQRRKSDPDGYRFGMLEVVREFGLEQLETAAELHLAQDALARYVLQLGERAQPELLGPAQPAWLDRLDAERDNLVTVLVWLLEQDCVSEAAALASNTIVFRDVRGYNLTDLPHLENLLAHPGITDDHTARAQALLAVGAARLYPIGYQAGVAAIDEAVGIFRRLGLDEWAAFALRLEIRPLYVMGEIERGKEAAAKCLRLGRRLALPAAEIVGLQELSAHAWISGDIDSHHDYLDHGMRLASKLGAPGLLARTLHMQGTRSFALGGYDTAEVHIRESMDARDEIDARAAFPESYELLGRIAHLRGDLETARLLRSGRSGGAGCRQSRHGGRGHDLHRGARKGPRERRRRHSGVSPVPFEN